MIQINSNSVSPIVLKLDGYSSGAVDITFTNQLTEQTYQITLTPIESNACHVEFVYPIQTGLNKLIEVMFS